MAQFLTYPQVGPMKYLPELSEHYRWSQTVEELSVYVPVLLMKHKNPLKLLLSVRKSISLFKYEATVRQS